MNRSFVLVSGAVAAFSTIALASESLAQDFAAAQCAPLAARTSPPIAEPARRGGREPSAIETLAAANAAARQRPDNAVFEQARQIYVYAPGAIYELYTNPNFVSAILLEPGEALHEVAAGDTARWMVTQSNGENQIDGRTIVLVKPQNAGLRTNIVLLTNRRTYTIEALAHTGPSYSAEIAWCYPHNAEASASESAELNYRYRVRTVRGARPNWTPTRVYDDGRRTWIEMPAEVAAGDLPPLFVITPEGAELVNYRLQGARYMVDRVFDAAELRLGTRAPIVVRIERQSMARPRRTTRP